MHLPEELKNHHRVDSLNYYTFKAILLSMLIEKNICTLFSIFSTFLHAEKVFLQYSASCYITDSLPPCPITDWLWII